MLAPTVVWGLYLRALGAIYVVVFSSLLREARIFGGRRGIAPLAHKLRTIRRHFPSAQRYRYFPSLFWLLPAADACLDALAILGCALGGALLLGDSAALGGVASALLPQAWLFRLPTQPACAALYALFLSFDVVFDLGMPWDCLLLEAGALSVLLPERAAMPSLSSSSSSSSSSTTTTTTAMIGALDAGPHPLVAWAHRWLLFRLMVGFGRLKFVGSHTRGSDRMYIRDFCVFQPIPTRVGHFLHRRLPDAAHFASLLLMFGVECVAPWALHVGGARWRPVAGALIGSLQLGIQLTGNFGYEFHSLAMTSAFSFFYLHTHSSSYCFPLTPLLVCCNIPPGTLTFCRSRSASPR
jgi:hypothetical protein